MNKALLKNEIISGKEMNHDGHDQHMHHMHSDDEEDACKVKHRNEAERHQLNNRLNRIEGQLRGIRQMIHNDIYCDDILIQISAVNNSIKSLGRLLLNNHMKSCVKDELLAGNDDIIDEVIKSFSKLY